MENRNGINKNRMTFFYRNVDVSVIKKLKTRECD